MDTLRVDICYRPLRIGWAIRAGDFDAYRQAVRYSHALWGGRFNPILVVDHEDEAQRLVDMFRVDFIWPLGDSQEMRDFSNKFPNLINPFPHFPIFSNGSQGYRPSANVLDVHNALAHLQDKPELKAMRDKGVRMYTWQDNDPLADVFLSQFGAYPNIEETGFDYRAAIMTATEAAENALNPTAPIPSDTIEHPSISYISRHGLERHHNVRAGWDFPGFFVGDTLNLDDLVCHWNLRACDIPLWFVDPLHMGRYSDIIPAWEKAMRDQVANYRHESDRQVAVWTRQENIDEACKPFGDAQLMRCHVSDFTWNGLNVKAPTMHLGQTSVLGVMGNDKGKPRVSFALADKPFCSDHWFYQQHLVASISFIGGLYGDEQHTFDAPYLPELNEFYARTMHFQYNKLRVEPERIGLIIDAADHDSFLSALPVADLMERIFDMIGYNAKLSSAGLITRQLVARLGGLQGARVFKIPEVRRLIKTHGPIASFTKKCALQLIGTKDANSPDAKFSDHEHLYIEQRARGEKLKPDAVFGYPFRQKMANGLFGFNRESATNTTS